MQVYDSIVFATYLRKVAKGTVNGAIIICLIYWEHSSHKYNCKIKYINKLLIIFSYYNLKHLNYRITMSKKYIENMEIGDILFVQSNKRFIALAQIFTHFLEKKGNSSVVYKDFHFTHVILSLGKGLFVDAIGGRGVSIFTLQKLIDDFENEYTDNLKVFRKKTLTDKQKETIFKKAEYYLFEDYNLIGINSKRKRKGKSYCSELIKNIYEGTGISFGDSYKAHPIDLYEKFLDDKNWNDDITEHYKDIVKSNDSLDIFTSNMYLEIFSLNLLMNTLIKLTNVYTSNFKTLPQSSYFSIYPNTDHTILSCDEFTKTLNLQRSLEKEDSESIKTNDIFSSLSILVTSIKEKEDDRYLEKLSDEDLITNWRDNIDIEKARSLVNKDKDEQEKCFYESIDMLEQLQKTLISIIEIYKSDKFKQEYYYILENLCSYVQSNFPSDIDIEEEIGKFKSNLHEQDYKKILLAIKNIYKVKEYYRNDLSTLNRI